MNAQTRVMARATPQHHLSDDLLFDYATGACDEAQSLMVATHLSYCDRCAQRLAQIEAIGGAMLEEIAPEPVTDLDFESLLSRLDQPAEDAARPHAEPHPDWMPEPLRDYVGAELDRLWKPVTRGIDEIELTVSGRFCRAKLLRIRAGTAVPKHTHKGSELTLVMAGSFSDATGTYGKGDVALGDDQIDHQPVAGSGGDCICLVVLDAPLRLTGKIGRFLNPFVRF